MLPIQYKIVLCLNSNHIANEKKKILDKVKDCSLIVIDYMCEDLLKLRMLDIRGVVESYQCIYFFELSNLHEGLSKLSNIDLNQLDIDLNGLNDAILSYLNSMKELEITELNNGTKLLMNLLEEVKKMSTEDYLELLKKSNKGV